MRVRLREEALGDLAAIRDWYAERNPTVARSPVERVRARLIQLRDFPELAPTEPRRADRALPVNRTPLLIIYRIDWAASVVDVVSIADARRDPERRFRP